MEAIKRSTRGNSCNTACRAEDFEQFLKLGFYQLKIPRCGFSFCSGWIVAWPGVSYSSAVKEQIKQAKGVLILQPPTPDGIKRHELSAYEISGNHFNLVTYQDGILCCHQLDRMTYLQRGAHHSISSVRDIGEENIARQMLDFLCYYSSEDTVSRTLTGLRALSERNLTGCSPTYLTARYAASDPKVQDYLRSTTERSSPDDQLKITNELETRFRKTLSSTSKDLFTLCNQVYAPACESMKVFQDLYAKPLDKNVTSDLCSLANIFNYLLTLYETEVTDSSIPIESTERDTEEGDTEFSLNGLRPDMANLLLESLFMSDRGLVRIVNRFAAIAYDNGANSDVLESVFNKNHSDITKRNNWTKHDWQLNPLKSSSSDSLVKAFEARFAEEPRFLKRRTAILKRYSQLSSEFEQNAYDQQMLRKLHNDNIVMGVLNNLNNRIINAVQLDIWLEGARLSCEKFRKEGIAIDPNLYSLFLCLQVSKLFKRNLSESPALHFLQTKIAVAKSHEEHYSTSAEALDKRRQNMNTNLEYRRKVIHEEDNQLFDLEPKIVTTPLGGIIYLS